MAIERDYSGDARLDPSRSHSGSDSISRVADGGAIQNGATYEQAVEFRQSQIAEARERERVSVVDPERESTIPRPPEIEILDDRIVTIDVHPIASEANETKTSANVEPAPEPDRGPSVRGVLPWLLLPVGLVAYLMR